MPRKIFVRAEPAGSGYQAMADDDHRIWGRGDRVASAIGALLEAHPEAFGVEIIHDASCAQVASRIADELVKIHNERKRW